MSETFDPCVGCDEICGGLMNCTEKKLFEAMQADIDVRDKVINKLERANEVLKEACEKITTLQLLDYDLVDARVFADKALSKIRSEGNE